MSIITYLFLEAERNLATGSRERKEGGHAAGTVHVGVSPPCFACILDGVFHLLSGLPYFNLSIALSPHGKLGSQP